MADYKAVSMNLMLGDIGITDSIYAPLLGSEIQRRITDLASAPNGPKTISESEHTVTSSGNSDRELAETLRKLASRLDETNR